jgi:hypothetical protein
MTTKVPHKNTQLIEVLLNHFGRNMNLARIKFFGMFICALCKVQTGSKSDSSLRRIQRFMLRYAEYGYIVIGHYRVAFAIRLMVVFAGVAVVANGVAGERVGRKFLILTKKSFF